MKPYLAVLSARFRVLLQYRAAAVAGVGTQLFWGLLRVMIFTAFYASSTAAMPMTLPETITYIWLGQALLLLVPFRGDAEVRQMIRTGNVAYELVRPTDLYWLWYSRAIAQRVAPVILRAVPMFALASLFFGLQRPASLESCVAFAVSIVGSVLLGSAISTFISISLFWTISGEGMARLLYATVWALSGILVPLPFFPDWLQPMLNALPFRGLLDVPLRLYMGHIPAHGFPLLLLHQLAWTVGVILLCRFLVSRSMKKLVIQGG